MIFLLALLPFLLKAQTDDTTWYSVDYLSYGTNINRLGVKCNFHFPSLSDTLVCSNNLNDTTPQLYWLNDKLYVFYKCKNYNVLQDNSDVNNVLYFSYFKPIRNDSTKNVSVSNRIKLQKAVDSAAQSHLKLIINGTYYIDSTITIAGKNNFEIVGDKGSKLILKSRRLDRYRRYFFYIKDNEGNSTTDIAIRNLIIDGNRWGNTNLTDSTIAAGIRIEVSSQEANIILQGLTIQYVQANAINVVTGAWVYVDNCFFYSNLQHGLGANPGSGVIASNIVSLENVGSGIDASGGKMILNNAVCMYNQQHGMKTSQGQSYLQADNLVLSFNNDGFVQTATPDSATIQIGKMRVEGNKKVGINIGMGRNLSINDLVLTNNNTSGAGGGNNAIENATINNLYVEEKGTLPAINIDGGAVYINSVRAIRNTGTKIFNVIAGSNLTINSGYFNSNNSIGIYSFSANNYININNVIFNETTTLESVSIGGTTRTLVSGCDFTNKSGLKINTSGSSFQLQTERNSGISNNNSPRSAILLSNQTTTSSALSDVAGMSIELSANKKYFIIGTLKTACSGTGGLKISFTVPFSSTFLINDTYTRTNNSALSLGSISKSGATNSNSANVVADNGSIIFQGYIVTSTVAGNVKLQLKSQTEGQISTIYSGSGMHVMEVQ